jgi:hypothetical protein
MALGSQKNFVSQPELGLNVLGYGGILWDKNGYNVQLLDNYGLIMG